MMRTVFLGAAVAAVMALSACGESSPNAPAQNAPQASNGITVLSPNGNESFQVGGKIRIQWSSTNADFSSARLLVGCGGDEWYDLTTSSIDKKAADTSLTIPDSVYKSSLKRNVAFPASTTCKVKIMDYVVTSILDTSDAPFTILAK